MDKSIVELLQAQAQREAEASQLYLALAYWCEASGYPGCASYLRGESADERRHMRGFVDFLANYADVPTPLPLVSAIAPNAKDLADVFASVLRTELTVTARISEIAAAACAAGAYDVAAFLQPYLGEQVSSVSIARDHVRRLAECQGDPAALLAFDASFVPECAPIAVPGG